MWSGDGEIDQYLILNHVVSKPVSAVSAWQWAVVNMRLKVHRLPDTASAKLLALCNEMLYTVAFIGMAIGNLVAFHVFSEHVKIELCSYDNCGITYKHFANIWYLRDVW